MTNQANQTLPIGGSEGREAERLLERMRAEAFAECSFAEEVEASYRQLLEDHAYLREALSAARDAMLAFQKQAGWLPQQQAYSCSMTQAEKDLADAVASIDGILQPSAAAALTGGGSEGRQSEEQADGLLGCTDSGASTDPPSTSRRPSGDEISRLEGAAWDANVDHVLVWERDQRDAALVALRSIANSSCCGGCQEAARVARAALRGIDGD